MNLVPIVKNIYLGLLNKTNNLTGGVTCAEAAQFDSVIYMDNRFPDALEQVLHFYKNGLFDKNETILVFRYHNTSFKKTVQLCERHGISFHWFWHFKDIPAFHNAQIFYPFNAQSNCRVTLNRSCKHILLLHGESNKSASVPPINRIYDYILVAGEIACQRLIEYRIFRPDEIERGRVICFGDLMIQPIEEVTAYISNTNDCSPALFYAPTWEGGVPAENFSSLENYYGANVTIELAAKAAVKNIIIKLHPNTGCRLSKYLDDAKQTILKLVENGLTVHYIATSESYIYLHLLRSLDQQNIISQLPQTPFPVKIGLCDVSGMEAVFSAKNIPNMVIVKNREAMRAPQIYFQLRDKNIIEFGSYNLPSHQSVNAIMGEHIHDQNSYYKKLVCWQDKSLTEATSARRREWLKSYIDKDSYWLTV